MQELDDSLMAFKDNSTPRDMLSPDNTREWESLIEAPTWIYRSPYYYLFYSVGGCWTEDKYCVMVTRSLSLDLPFIKMQDALQISNSIILSANSNILAPGYRCVAIEVDHEYMLFHAGENGEDQNIINFDGRVILKRKLFMKELSYVNGWPLLYK